MKSRFAQIVVGFASPLVAILAMSSLPADEPLQKNDSTSVVAKNDVKKVEDEKISGVSLEVARDRAKMLQSVYLSTLDVIHHRYFHLDRALIPARAMEEVFVDMKKHTHTEARWIAVSLKAMSLNHEAETDFEKRAVREIKAGERQVEGIDNGYYRRAVAVPLTGGCVTCHDGFFRQTSPSAMFAGLVVSVPVKDGESIPASEAESK